VWAFGGPIDPPPPKGRQVYFGRTISTAAVHDGLVYIAEETGYIHCLDANTGFRCWDHDFKASVWGSPYYVDGKVYIGTEDGDIFIFAPSKERAYWKDGKLTLANKAGDKVLPATNMDEVIHSTPVVANGVLYITTRSKLYAIGGK
jgi:outer membrane protein assembly factor BamB